VTSFQVLIECEKSKDGEHRLIWGSCDGVIFIPTPHSSANVFGGSVSMTKILRYRSIRKINLKAPQTKLGEVNEGLSPLLQKTRTFCVVNLHQFRFVSSSVSFHQDLTDSHKQGNKDTGCFDSRKEPEHNLMLLTKDIHWFRDLRDEDLREILRKLSKWQSDYTLSGSHRKYHLLSLGKVLVTI
jgi:hypothetical protein